MRACVDVGGHVGEYYGAVVLVWFNVVREGNLLLDVVKAVDGIHSLFCILNDGTRVLLGNGCIWVGCSIGSSDDAVLALFSTKVLGTTGLLGTNSGITSCLDVEFELGWCITLARCDTE